MTVPGEGHKDVGDGQQENGMHPARLTFLVYFGAFRSDFVRRKTDKSAFKLALQALERCHLS
jgi:hypothetical protein